MRIHTIVPSPLGDLVLVGAETGDGLALASLSLPDQPNAPVPDARGDRRPEPFAALVEQLAAYFAGDLKEFSYEAAVSGTPFQRQVWTALDALPYGATTSYGELNAVLGGSPARVRAVGSAIGRNPLLILRPCHRVVGSTGALTGYAGGLPAKQALLTLEGALP
ncbi:methylated-DNA--[protein]-cysteine S-methyltransferase [Actinocorallia sp. API 0066]|uniref:methylated-DNA--[protein]-cysteine S-methyltransferase n=1 Tax=Actinocorallia sp. API 0066 TaxID=2896846 RepID=UPI001E566EA0|nr:methylated-DNA--[protein]-cysteine S-methyltransferase [Actinocorallia sp. API 0066]MCD0452760.1 methylated-DNA--[protein]-cysteine S-methyltransferase [Actinocorallia sp. API 0066]